MKEIHPLLIRNIHRWSGLLLLPLVLLKILSGYSAAGRIPLLQPGSAYRIHSGLWMDIGVLFFLSIHAAYAFLRIFLPKIKNKSSAAWVASCIAGVTFIVSVYLLYL